MTKKSIIIVSFFLIFFMCSKPTEPKDTEPPKVAIVYPANQADIIQGTVVTIKTDVSDNEAIKEVNFYIDGELALTKKTEPYQYDWDTQEYLGSHTIRAKAVDNSDNVGESNVVSVKIIEPVVNILSGYIKNALSQPVVGATITLEPTGTQVDSSNPKAETSASHINSILRDPNLGRIPKSGITDSGIEKSVRNPKIISQLDYNISKENTQDALKKTASWTAQTDENGYYEIKELEEGNYSLNVTSTYYQDYSTTYLQTEGLVQKDFQLIASAISQVSSLSLVDGDYSITVNWNSSNYPTIKGYNVYEQHYLRYKDDYEEDQYYYYPHYSEWRKVNTELISNQSYTISSEEYNGRYGFYILPVNIDDFETAFSDYTDTEYIGLPINNLPLVTFSLTESTKPIYIPDDTHEISLHMGYYYSTLAPFKWSVQISTDSLNWSTIGSNESPPEGTGGYVPATHYGYTKTISLNAYKGKVVYFRTEPVSKSAQISIENKVMDYNQDGSGFSHNTDPTASFTFSPTSGNTTTTFQFDASGSSDNEDASSALEVRWDWENDGSWDTGYSTTKTASHQYSSGGTKTVKLEVKDSGGLTNTTSQSITINNTAPTASFTISPTSGNTSTTFQFDASGSSDNEDASSALEVRWDWENDGSWDTGYSTTKTTSHQYSSEGTKTVKLEVKDSGGLLNTTTKQVSVSNGSGGETGTMIDQDGNVYQTVKIGNQWWMSENLKVTHYRNGDDIPNVTDNSEWVGLSTGAWCAYNNYDGNIDTYGLLYNWYAVDDSRNIAPAGWHVPTDEEWKELEMYLGMSQSEADYTGYRGTDEGGKLKETGTTHWYSSNTGATNESGFTALPGGYRDKYGSFVSIGSVAIYWSATAYGSNNAWNRSLNYYYSGVYRYYGSKRDGFSLRCIRD